HHARNGSGNTSTTPDPKRPRDRIREDIRHTYKSRGKFQKPSRMSKIIKYKDHPMIHEKLGVRYRHYNDTLKYLYEQEKENNAFLIAPSKPLKISRTERNKKRLEALYELGWKDAEAEYSRLQAFLRSD